MHTHAQEFNFDGLIGPTHNYAGLSYGNVASAAYRGSVSSPRQAALQGLAKMKLLAELGAGQAVLPPQPRPDLALLRAAGFGGDDATIIERAFLDAPQLLAAAYSASGMWAANAATVSPGPDTLDGRLHITPANLVSQLHRSREAAFTTRVLRAIFADEAHFAVHDALPPAMHFSDEGAANHTWLCGEFDAPGIELFTYGRDALNADAPQPRRYPARQTKLASESIARRHGLRDGRAVFAQQHPDAIDAGVFHNDVICVGHQDVLLYHERAYTDTAATIEAVAQSFDRATGRPLGRIRVTSDELPLEDAVGTYLFNSQIVTLRDGEMAIIAPAECRENGAASRVLDRIIAGDNPIRQLHIVDLRQSMHNGGGPACLRLRIVLTPQQRDAMHQGVIWTPTLHERLVAWVEKYHRDELRPGDLRDPQLMRQSDAAMDEIAGIFDLRDTLTVH